MQSTGGVANRFAPLAARLERRLTGGLPFAVRFWDGSELRPEEGRGSGDTLLVRDSRALSYIATAPGQLGLARAWVAGDLDVDGDLERALRAGERFRDLRLGLRDKAASALAAARAGALRLRRPSPPASEAHPSGRLHSLRRDREAVRHHYDVSNDFYRLVLGPSMVYSCAYFDSPRDTLEEAQMRKLEVICHKLRLTAGERLLDVGCGWGSLVIHAAQNHGARAVGITLSEPQAELARERIRELGIEHRCEVRVQDYREVDDGPFDKVASVGMYEHVGAARLDEYMRRLRGLARPGGLVLNHGIVRLASGPRRRNTFIWRYVFPDGELHPVGAVVASMERAGLELRDAESLREHYTLTLHRWVENLAANREQAVAEVGEERERIWRLYMTGSALAFERGDISVQQLLASVPGAPAEFPLARPWRPRVDS
ncbi:MAG TPA: cyclopropane-fatty-acyl-phospholipid synthase family protein [Solirubrobacterales bacterium]